MTGGPSAAAARRSVVEDAIERMARAVPDQAWRWVILDRPDLVGPVLDAAGVPRSGQLVIARFSPELEHVRHTFQAPVGATLLGHLLRESGLCPLDVVLSAGVAAAVTLAIGAPVEADVAGLIVVSAPVEGVRAADVEPKATLAVNSWDGYRFTPAPLEVPTLPPMERFRTFGICGSCLEAGACRLGAVTRIDADGVVRGSVTIPEEYAGSPGLAHGGFVATIFDDVLSRVAAHNVLAAMTGTYEVAFRGPVPTRSRLSIEATLDSVAGRKRVVSARLRDKQGKVLAEGSGTWIEVTAVPETRGEG